MKFKLNTLDLLNIKSDCLVIGVFENGELSEEAHQLNEISHHYLLQTLKKMGFEGKTGQTYLFPHMPSIQTECVLVVGCGKNNPVNAADYRKIIINSIRALSRTPFKTVTMLLTLLPCTNNDLAWKIKHCAESCDIGLYSFDQFKSKKSPVTVLEELTLVIPTTATEENLSLALKQAQSISSGLTFTKNLANLPSNICTPDYLAQQAHHLAAEFSAMKVTVLGEAEIEKLGMGAFIAVTKGSALDGKLICIEYQGGKSGEAPVAFVGKGVTFDTGGISLKPADSMIGMKYDMCGAATVLGTIKAAAELNLPINLVGIIVSAENMPSGTASKPEDIVTTLSGQTVEIMNTDAEGRLLLCEGLTYAERYNPDVVIDIATLTGAVVIALGHHASGLLTNNDELAADLLSAGIEAQDRAWQLPLWEDYQEQLKSPFADMSNVGGRAAGTITAACFLSRFAKAFKWAHLDVAGTAAMMGGGSERYATGRPVPLLVQYLINRCKL